MATNLTPVGELRPATPDDAAAILDLNLLRDLAEVGEPSTTIDEVDTDLDSQHLLSAVLVRPDGDLAGYVWIEYVPGQTKSYGAMVIRPGAEASVGPSLISWLLARRGEIAPDLPFHAFADSKDTTQIPLYERAGGTVIRHFFRMAVDFTSPPAAPILGAGVAIRGVDRTESDLRAVHRVVDTSFMDHFGHEAESYERWLATSANGSTPDLSLWWLATVDGEPAAALYGSLRPGLGYIDTLGTLREFRGRGLGRALLMTSFAAFYDRGLRRAVLGVDATNPTGALQLYESAGMSAEHEGLRFEIRP